MLNHGGILVQREEGLALFVNPSTKIQIKKLDYRCQHPLRDLNS